MDVTALLNESSSAVDQQRKGNEVLRLPTRSRTPWDAGGYSLPLNTAALKITSPEVDQQDAFNLEEDDTTTIVPFTSVMPTSPVHKFTDSRSSLSSFASSSLHSANHSRYSSISTLNSPRALTGHPHEPMLSPNPPLQSVEMSYFRSRDEEELQTRFHQDHSPTKSLDTLAQIAEDYHSGESSSPRVTTSESGRGRQFHSQKPEEGRPNQFTPRHSRSISNGGSASSGTPNAEVWTSIESDMQGVRGIKMKSADVSGRHQMNDIERPNSPSDTLLIKRTTVPTLHLNTHDHHLQIPNLADQHYPTKSHKRANSAPNFAGMDINRFHPAPMAHEPTPPASIHPDQGSPRAPFEQSPPHSPPTAAGAPIPEPVCMYIDDCDTDSPQRKAISHIFGRNKMCTRMIPEHLWVHLCRKHYQRCRYRDQDKWAKAQCDLVQIQIRRIHEWSMTNQINGSGIRLQNWTLTMRKRERMRRMKLAQEAGASASKRKRGASQDDDDAVDSNESGYPSTTTKVPDWLVDHCDKEFSTAGILVVFNRLHQDIIDGRVGPHFPDLELLPNLLTPEGNEKKATKPAAKVTPRKAHQRSQSLQTPSTHESPFRDSATKRRRPNEELPFERGIQPTMRQPIRRPAYPSINEHEVSEAFLPRPYHDSLLAPTAQRMAGQSMADHLEAGNYRTTRPMHSRSYSDASAYSNASMHPSPEHHQMGLNYNHNHMAGPSNGHFEMGQPPRMGRVAPSLEYAHSGHAGGRDYGTDERTMMGRGHRMEEMSYNTESQGRLSFHSPMMMGQHDNMMGGRDVGHMGHNRHNSSPQRSSQYVSPQQHPQQHHHFSSGPYNSPQREQRDERYFQR